MLSLGFPFYDHYDFPAGSDSAVRVIPPWTGNSPAHTERIIPAILEFIA